MFVNILNPNAWLYWSLGAGPRLAVAWRESPARALAFLAGFYVLLVGGNAALILIAGRLARAGAGVARGLSLASGVVLVGFGGWTLAKALLGA
jgi:threonine/homoserine/homoserine lactone efflux protein